MVKLNKTVLISEKDNLDQSHPINLNSKPQQPSDFNADKITLGI